MIPLRDNFQAGEPVGNLGAEWFNQVARWLNGLQCTNGQVTRNFGSLIITPYNNFASSGGTINAAWYASKSGDLEISIARGDIEIAPQDVIAWGDITDAAETITIPSGETEWHIWVEVDVVNLSATMFSANTIDALDSTEERTKLIKRIADVTISADVITAVRACQCGNIYIIAK